MKQAFNVRMVVFSLLVGPHLLGQDLTFNGPWAFPVLPPVSGGDVVNCSSMGTIVGNNVVNLTALAVVAEEVGIASSCAVERSARRVFTLGPDPTELFIECTLGGILELEDVPGRARVSKSSLTINGSSISCLPASAEIRTVRRQPIGVGPVNKHLCLRPRQYVAVGTLAVDSMIDPGVFNDAAIADFQVEAPGLLLGVDATGPCRLLNFNRAWDWQDHSRNLRYCINPNLPADLADAVRFAASNWSAAGVGWTFTEVAIDADWDILVFGEAKGFNPLLPIADEPIPHPGDFDDDQLFPSSLDPLPPGARRRLLPPNLCAWFGLGDVDENGEVRKGALCFNTDVPFGTSIGDGLFDPRVWAMHELGHTVRLLHAENPIVRVDPLVGPVYDGCVMGSNYAQPNVHGINPLAGFPPNSAYSLDPHCDVPAAIDSSIFQAWARGDQPVTWQFFGIAQGGEISARITGPVGTCRITIVTRKDQSTESVALSFAAAIQSDDCLAEQGISAVAQGGSVLMVGQGVEISDTIIADPGLQHVGIPTLSGLVAALLAILLVIVSLVLLRQQMHQHSI